MPSFDHLKKYLIPAIVAFLVILRVVSVFTIEPNNAPDENGHLAMVVADSQGKLVTLQESRSLTPYPYAIYNPVPYLPAIIALATASTWDPSLNRFDGSKISEGANIPHARRCDLIARVAMTTVWFGFYLFFLLLLVRNLYWRDQLFALAALGMLPQITFVQSYLNLDSMGLAVFLYLVWALRESRWGHVAASVFLVANAKMNFFCLLPLPVVVIAGKEWPHLRHVLKRAAVVVCLPAMAASWWYVFNYWVNTRPYGSFFGFSALVKMYGIVPGGSRVFSRGFLQVSLMSAFGVFGWMNQLLPEICYKIWTRCLLPAGALSLLVACFRFRVAVRERTWHLGFLAVVVANFVLHFMASYTNDFQPQGRYILPAAVILLAYVGWGIHQIRTKFEIRRAQVGTWIPLGFLAYMLYVAILSVKVSRLDPYHRGFPQDKDVSSPGVGSSARLGSHSLSATRPEDYCDSQQSLEGGHPYRKRSDLLLATEV